VIRQAISCDICATEKKQTNHWFVAYEQGGELRVAGWNTRNRLRPGSKHLCGQTCLHKLVDEFMAKALSHRVQASVADNSDMIEADPIRTDASLTSSDEFIEVESSARLLPTPTPIAPKRLPFQTPVEIVAISDRPLIPLSERGSVEEISVQLGEVPRFNSRAWRAEAWEREREREQRAAERRPDIAARRRAHS
jgi:hypothetical protein